MSLCREGFVNDVVLPLTNPKLLGELRKVHDFFLHSQFCGDL
jgi:hypothetical protein